MAGKKRNHQTSPTGIPSPAFDCEADTPIEVPDPQLSKIMKGLDVSVGFSTTNRLLSRVIRWVTRGSVSHAWIAYNDYTLGIRMVMQAEAHGLEIRPWKRWLQENLWIAEFRLLNHTPLRALQISAKSIGARYDWWSGFWTGLSAWLRRWAKSKFSIRPNRSPKRLMCSETVVRFLKELDVSCVKELDEEVTSPAELLDSVRCSMDFVPMRHMR